MRYLIGLVILATACGGSDEPAAVECDRADRDGTYLLELEEREGGTCGPIHDQLGRLDGGEGLNDACAFDAADVWSDGDCKLERAVTCEEPDIGAGVTASYIASTTQTDSNGDVLSSIMTMTVRNPDGSLLCKSTYEGTATRQ